MFCYFFKGNEYIRVTRGKTGPGNPPIDNGYPAKLFPYGGWGAFGSQWDRCCAF